MKKRIVIYLLTLGMFFSCLPSYAQEGGEERGKEELELLFSEINFDPSVITASKREQQLSDAPAVLTVITAERIKDLGAVTLMDVLKTIPGFNIIQDTNEHLTVLRGVFSSTNQKILVLKDGHTLNDPMFYTTEFDYSLPLDDISRIEVMRGPGSTIYGSAALMGTVNLITKKGEDISGTRVSVSAGNYGQYRGSATYGEKLNDETDLLLQASWYRSDGETINLEKEWDMAAPAINGFETVDQYPPCYYVGLKLTKGKFILTGSIRRSEYLPPRTNNGGFYDPDKTVRNANQVWNWGYLDLEYKTELSDGLTLALRHYVDWELWYSTQFQMPERQISPYGRWLYLEYSAAKGGLEYSITKVQDKYSYSFGLRAFNWEPFDDRYYHNLATSTIFAENEPLLLGPSGEYYYAGYVQFDVTFTDWLKLHLGASYDKYEYAGTSFNPRVALFITPAEHFVWKILYGEAFLNPAFFYRYISPGAMGYYGGPDLDPEVMKSFQTNLFYEIPEKAAFEITLFRNKLSDLVTAKATALTKTYVNYGEVTVEGAEPEVKVYLSKNFYTFVNATYQRPVTDDTVSTLLKNDTLKSIPEWTGNAGITGLFANQISIDLLLNWHGEIEVPDAKHPSNTIDKTYLVDVNVNWKIPQLEDTSVNLNVKNLFDQDNLAGGTVPVVYSQNGRWFLATISKKF